jgi:flagellar biosynthesis protein FliR
MSLRVDIGWLIATLLVSVRVAAATMIAPVLGPTQIPATARVLFTLALSALIVSALPLPQVAHGSLMPVVIAVFGEAIVGAAFAFGFIVAYSATQLAGRALDTQIGFGAAGILNPATQVMSPLIGNLLGMVAIAAFLALDGHLLLIKALSLSLQWAPPGALALDLDWSALLQHSGIMFTFALALAGPVMFMFLLSDLAMAVFARSMPQLNVFVLGFALKIVLGLTGLAVSLRFAGAVLNELFSTTFAYWERLPAR